MELEITGEKASKRRRSGLTYSTKTTLFRDLEGKEEENIKTICRASDSLRIDCHRFYLLCVSWLVVLSD
jgi:hypothetical protein